MDNPTTGFSLITFRDLWCAPFSYARIDEKQLVDRILFVRTNRGNFAKLEVTVETERLHIARCTVYTPQGIILKSSGGVRLKRGQSFDVETGKAASRGGDLWWNQAEDGTFVVESNLSAAVHLYPRFDEISFSSLINSDYLKQGVELPDGERQLIYCRTNEGNYAKLLLRPDKKYLLVERLETYDPKGKRLLEKANIEMQAGSTLNVSTGRVGKQRGDLRWNIDNLSGARLTPIGSVLLSAMLLFRYEAYRNLLRRPSIRRALVWVDARGTRSYDAWSDEEKQQLDDFICLRESGRELPLTGPPALTSTGSISATDAWQIYLAHVAQSLWVEANQLTPWRLSENTEELAHLFDMRKLMDYIAGRGHSFGVMGFVTHWNPKLSYDFLADELRLGYNRRSTILALVDWCRRNLIHIIAFEYDTSGGPFRSQEDQWEYLYGYRGLPLVEKMIHPLPGRRHVTHACWGTSGFLAAVLRTINISVRHGRSVFDSGPHSRTEFFSNDMYLGHGDDPYSAWIRLGRNNVPIERIFLSHAEVVATIDSPPLTMGRTVREQASYNHERRFVALAVEFKTRYLLLLRCEDIRTRAVGTESGLWQALHPYYTDAEIATITADCDRAIAAIPTRCSGI
jgi:hypothetical protein